MCIHSTKEIDFKNKGDHATVNMVENSFAISITKGTTTSFSTVVDREDAVSLAHALLGLDQELRNYEQFHKFNAIKDRAEDE